MAALPRLVSAADDATLRKALSEHLEQTRRHVERLRHIITDVGIGGMSGRCEGMAGLLAEGERVVRVPESGAAKDAALIGAAQRVEHYEIAAYGTARTLASELGYDDAAGLLGETLREESHADGVLNEIATGGLLRGGTGARQAPVLGADVNGDA